MNLKKVERYIAILITCLFLTWPCKSQDRNCYEEAYRWIQNDKLKDTYISRVIQAKPCIEIVGSDTVRIPKNIDSFEIHVANRFVRNDPFPVMCDILVKKYKTIEPCTEVLGLNKKIAVHVRDSIREQYQGYNFTFSTVPAFSSRSSLDVRDGVVLFFSDMYENSLYAELKYFCLPYDNEKAPWVGTSIVYYFIFDDGNEIVDVYKGKKYYN